MSDNERWAEETNVKLHLIFLLNCTPLLHVIHAVAGTIPHCENVVKKFKNVTLSIIASEQSNALPACFSDIQKTNKVLDIYALISEQKILMSVQRGRALLGTKPILLTRSQIKQCIFKIAVLGSKMIFIL